MDSWFDPDALREARVQAGLTQSGLARLIGVAGGERVSKWELGAAVPRPGALLQLAEALGVSPGRLLRPGQADLRRLRLARGLLARELAARAHIALPTLLRWEDEGLQRGPDAAAVASLADALGVSTSEVQNALARSRSGRRP